MPPIFHFLFFQFRTFAFPSESCYNISVELSVQEQELFRPHAKDMYAPRAGKAVRRQRSHKCVESMCGHIDSAFAHGNHNRRMVKIARRGAKLHNVADFQFVQRRPLGKRPFAFVCRHKIIQIFHARPRGCAVIQIFVIPAESGSVVHYTRSCIYTLRGEVGAVAAQAVKIIKSRVAPERPHLGVG